MVQVVLTGAMRALAGGVETVEIEASTFKEVLDGLRAAHPALAPVIDRGVSLAVDGLVYRNSWFTPVKPDSEVVVMPYMKGG
ncbi:MoaD/ThiS family protein [Roseovarius sp. LXJ103]|uniref:MoaD/ThiS family protein n=1 Tax=Roseovarius carneus TaxID=2853164 RepID=UPI000D605105|nr:MoaD/ThiS family protein [Roseovarius carneus]MBZ8119529.1 MoaD/ThiS family protein [Roseovarius carneus]PWE34845.1 molybdopterin synthase sulfur carrier subunit [Pelagicola sp. LXJ1103]